MANVLSDTERELMDAYWRAANYLSIRAGLTNLDSWISGVSA